MHLCVCRCPLCPYKLLVANYGVIWTPYDWLNISSTIFICMASVLILVLLVGVALELKHIIETKPNKTKLAPYELILSLLSVV